MNKVILEYLMKQGPTLFIVCCVAYLFYDKTKELETKIDNCQGQQIELLKTTVQENTKAMSALADEIKENRNNK